MRRDRWRMNPAACDSDGNGYRSDRGTATGDQPSTTPDIEFVSIENTSWTAPEGKHIECRNNMTETLFGSD